jgi:hypothetical protein
VLVDAAQISALSTCAAPPASRPSQTGQGMPQLLQWNIGRVKVRQTSRSLTHQPALTGCGAARVVDGGGGVPSGVHGSGSTPKRCIASVKPITNVWHLDRATVLELGVDDEHRCLSA